MPINSSLRTAMFVATACLFAGCSSGGSQSFLAPTRPLQQQTRQSASKPQPGAHQRSSGAYVYVSNRTDQGASQLLVYRAGVSHPTPIRTITQGLVEAGGIAVDSSGNVYIANGKAGNVLEFAPGGESLVQTYSKDLVHPVDVATANGTLYVADRGSAANGYGQQIMEYATGNPKPLIGIAGLGDQSELNQGIAVDPLATDGTFFASSSSLTDIPPSKTRPNSGSSLFAENILPTLWMDIPLSHNQQASGMALDSNENLYVSDLSANKVEIYHMVDYRWAYSGEVSGNFNAPFFLTINNQVLAIPSAGTAGSRNPGYVTLIDLTRRVSSVTITNGLQHPIGAAVGTNS